MNSQGNKRGWDKYDSSAAISAPKLSKLGRFGLKRSYTLCVAGCAGWAMVQFVGLLLVSFGLAEGDLWWLTVTVNCIKWAFMLVFAAGLFLVWHNASAEKKQPLCRVIPFVFAFCVACSLFRIFVAKASYGGFNTVGKAFALVLVGIMLVNYRKKPPYIPNLWKYAGVSAALCYISAGLMVIMFMSMQILDFTFMQYVFALSFYGAEGAEVIAVTSLAVYYVLRRRLVRESYERQ